MPPKGKATPKPKGTDTATAAATAQPSPAPALPSTTPSTVLERTQKRLDESQGPYEAARRKAGGLCKLAQAEQLGWITSLLARSSSTRARAHLGPKAQKDLWRHANEASLPIRYIKNSKGTTTTTTTTTTTATSAPVWGTDRAGQDVGEYTIARFEDRAAKAVALTTLEVASRGFREARDRADRGLLEPVTKEQVVVTEREFDEEKARRREMAALRRELYGQETGQFAQNPEWDDVEPIPQDEPEKELAAIAYPAEYAEAVSYLRAVMLKKEYSARCLRLTAYIIDMNPAHYTVWLYRASILFAMKLSIPNEIEWLNEVALEHLKNYQIWHHRHLLVDNYYPTIASSPDEVSKFAASERQFLATILAEDTKNYHVWSYRSYLVEKLGMFGDADELATVEALIDDDVRNNSAWSHRFFLVFSDPAHSTPGSGATDPDPAVPAEVIDREVKYAMNKIDQAPQNQSPWNYLRGALVKGGRKLASVEEFVAGFVNGLGEGEEEEDVRSTHALDLLAEIWEEKGDKEKADLALKRLGEKWDRIRVGYWEWRRSRVNN